MFVSCIIVPLSLSIYLCLSLSLLPSLPSSLLKSNEKMSSDEDKKIINYMKILLIEFKLFITGGKGKPKVGSIFIVPIQSEKQGCMKKARAVTFRIPILSFLCFGVSAF